MPEFPELGGRLGAAAWVGPVEICRKEHARRLIAEHNLGAPPSRQQALYSQEDPYTTIGKIISPSLSARPFHWQTIRSNGSRAFRACQSTRGCCVFRSRA